jgi:hypothetical protein
VGDGRVATVLTPLQRLVGLDQGDARIAEGLRITLEVLGRMDESCAERCRLAVVLLPTKELVFEGLAAGGEDAPRELVDLLHWEKRMREQTRDYLGGRGIAWIDTLPALQAAIGRGENPYPRDWNGHLNALGNDLVAGAVAESAPLRALVRGVPALTGAPSGSGAP